MKSSDISAYWQTYADLTDLWAKGVWDEADLAAHFTQHGEPEGRRIVDISTAPDDWSDRLYFANTKNDFEWWWNKGVIDSGIFAALNEGGAALERGCISRNPSIRERSSLSDVALQQIVENAAQNFGKGPLRDVISGEMRWGQQKATGLLGMEQTIRQMVDAQHGYVIVLPWLESGGAELVGLWHYLAAEKLGLNPIIILGDKPNVTERFLEQNVKTLNLPQIYQDQTGVEFSHISRDDRVEILTMALEILTPERMHLIHSYVGYTALTLKSSRARMRAACGQIYVSAFCPHIHPNSAYDGYFRYIPELEGVVDQFIFDNTWYLREMESIYCLKPSQSCSLKYPVDGLHTHNYVTKKRQKVLWASRFDSQKNPQIVGEIAAKMPDTDFVMYGRRVMGDVVIDWDKMPPNVTDMGEFFNIDQLPLGDAFAFLYTSKFDGTPNILMEIASRGVPIVTPNIGGISDFLGENWPLYVEHPEDVDGYVRHLSRLKSSPKEAKKRIAEQNNLLLAERNFEAFIADFAKKIGVN